MSVSSCKSYLETKPITETYPKTTGITYFDDWELINNTDSFLIKTAYRRTNSNFKKFRSKKTVCFRNRNYLS